MGSFFDGSQGAATWSFLIASLIYRNIATYVSGSCLELAFCNNGRVGTPTFSSVLLSRHTSYIVWYKGRQMERGCLLFSFREANGVGIRLFSDICPLLQHATIGRKKGRKGYDAGGVILGISG